VLFVAAGVAGAAHGFFRSKAPQSFEGAAVAVLAARHISGPIDVTALGEIVTMEELARVIRQKANVLVVDVRLGSYYEEGHIPGAVNLNRRDFEKGYSALRPQMEKTGKVILYCTNIYCDDSKKMAKRLRELGHKNISFFSGGWEQWDAKNR
jgi:rhodanese-related sulfurtransferase